jgi:hypothetical protein
MGLRFRKSTYGLYGKSESGILDEKHWISLSNQTSREIFEKCFGLQRMDQSVDRNTLCNS